MSDDRAEVEAAPEPEAQEVEVDTSESEAQSYEGDAEENTSVAAAPQDDIKSELAELRRRAEAAEARATVAQDMFTNNNSAQQRARQEEEERERIYNMTPEERLLYAADQQERRLQQITQQAEQRIADANDRAEYAILAASNPMAKKYQPEVERRLAEAKSHGYNYSREVMLTYIAGEKALAAVKGGGDNKQRQAAEENKQRSSSNATSGVGDQKVNGRIAADDKAARDERLRNPGAYY